MDSGGVPVEEWRPVADAEGYEVSSRGRVRSWRAHNGKRRRAVKVLSPSPDSDGYLEGIFSTGSRKRKYKVHVEVLKAFSGHRPEGYVAAHNDGNRQNNVISNLRWTTPKGNSEDRTRHGNDLQGERHPDAKLTEDLVREIRASSLTGEEWARRLNMRRCSINKARAGTSWKHVA